MLSTCNTICQDDIVWKKFFNAEDIFYVHYRDSSLHWCVYWLHILLLWWAMQSLVLARRSISNPFHGLYYMCSFVYRACGFKTPLHLCRKKYLHEHHPDRKLPCSRDHKTKPQQVIMINTAQLTALSAELSRYGPGPKFLSDCEGCLESHPIQWLLPKPAKAISSSSVLYSSQIYINSSRQCQCNAVMKTVLTWIWVKVSNQ